MELASCRQNLYDIYHCCVYSEKTPDDGQRNCPKHVEFYSKSKFEKLVHAVGYYKNISQCTVILMSNTSGIEVSHNFCYFIHKHL